MKGISPLLAVVLLIAFTISIAGIIGVWLTTYARTAAGGVERRTAGYTECAGVYVKVNYLYLTSNFNTTKPSIVISNPSDRPIYVSNASLTATGKILTLVSGGKTQPFFRLGSFGVKTFELENYNNTDIDEPAEVGGKLTVRGVCESTAGNVSIEGSCSEGETCWVLG